MYTILPLPLFHFLSILPDVAFSHTKEQRSVKQVKFWEMKIFSAFLHKSEKFVCEHRPQIETDIGQEYQPSKALIYWKVIHDNIQNYVQETPGHYPKENLLVLDIWIYKSQKIMAPNGRCGHLTDEGDGNSCDCETRDKRTCTNDVHEKFSNSDLCPCT